MCSSDLERYVLMSGTREFDEVVHGTAAECSMGYCEIMGHELRVERDEDGRWFYSLNTSGYEDDWEEYDEVPCDGDEAEALREAPPNAYQSPALSYAA